eukprot:CAMPEP_0174704750 /NCGR_PEP_ID=MMETSP1094-20130205/8222_1 /TAXON_ID=156173 /ORGANISM="Chrysochromulina brevifilum, Strain UTEX LB 985" /LENGTH=329 /DNA_ID=CAMNT_0015902835 /DNA_START=13 /DNA_END=1002 /DNA_ORIENTATION=+
MPSHVSWLDTAPLSVVAQARLRAVLFRSLNRRRQLALRHALEAWVAMRIPPCASRMQPPVTTATTLWPPASPEHSREYERLLRLGELFELEKLDRELSRCDAEATLMAPSQLHPALLGSAGGALLSDSNPLNEATTNGMGRLLQCLQKDHASRLHRYRVIATSPPAQPSASRASVAWPTEASSVHRAHTSALSGSAHHCGPLRLLPVSNYITEISRMGADWRSHEHHLSLFNLRSMQHNEQQGVPGQLSIHPSSHFSSAATEHVAARASLSRRPNLLPGVSSGRLGLSKLLPTSHNLADDANDLEDMVPWHETMQQYAVSRLSRYMAAC